MNIPIYLLYHTNYNKIKEGEKMIYKKNQSHSLDMDLFKNPTSEYRAAPFWGWNCELDEEDLLWQIEQLKKMGFGGFYMHTRSGMSTKYLSDEFMQLIKSCTQKAKDENMLAWLYDEDRWPSGAAGGYVTATPRFRQRRLLFTTKRPEGIQPRAEALEEGAPYLLAIFDVVLSPSGELSAYRIIDEDEKAEGTVWYACVDVFSSFLKSPGWYNGGTYVDTLSKPAIEKFVEITHEKYKEAVGEDFGEAVPAIFTDEPQISHKGNLPFAHSQNDVSMAWTGDFDETFAAKYGYDIVQKLPELFWELEGGEVSVARYHYHDHTCERFTEAFSDTCGDWCEKNNISLTGHMFGEESLESQTRLIGEAMRAYRSFQLPGVDMLFNKVEYSTVKQAQSAARQYGREGVMSELYGVTNWDFDFRGHKFQGDWQAALGVTLRVPHLSWVSMKGSAKRDYPASLSFQSPWYKQYPYIEDHYARLATVLSRGKPCVNVAVIHPIESYWLHFGPEENTRNKRKQLDDNFDNMINWLLRGTVDFDFICEATLPELCTDIGKRLSVGEMSYSCVIVPACETLRSTTVDILNKFADQGGRVIFAGSAPKYIDAMPSERIAPLWAKSEKAEFTRYSVLESLRAERDIEIKDSNGYTADQFVYQLRNDAGTNYLFIANVHPPISIFCNDTQPPTSAVIKIKGEYIPKVLNTMTGETEDAAYCSKDGFTTVYYDFYEQDSLLLSLTPGSGSLVKEAKTESVIGTIDFKHKVSYKREEDNVCVLDTAKYALDDGEFQDTEEILRIDKTLREIFDWPLATGQDMQPWAMAKEPATHTVTLMFEVNAAKDIDGVTFCAEELVSLMLNGEEIALKETGWFVDKSIKKYALPTLSEGKNIFTAKIPFSKSESLEACYLIGDFNVVLEGCDKTLTPPSALIGFGDITSQGMPFYGGNVTYAHEIEVSEDCKLRINIASYIGALTKVTIDGKDAGNIVFAPYDLEIPFVTKGKHTVEFTLFGNRHNTFGALHNCGRGIYYGQHYWYPTLNSWCYEYNLKKTGILKSPVITMYK